MSGQTFELKSWLLCEGPATLKNNKTSRREYSERGRIYINISDIHVRLSDMEMIASESEWLLDQENVSAFVEYEANPFVEGRAN